MLQVIHYACPTQCILLDRGAPHSMASPFRLNHFLIPGLLALFLLLSVATAQAGSYTYGSTNVDDDSAHGGYGHKDKSRDGYGSPPLMHGEHGDGYDEPSKDEMYSSGYGKPRKPKSNNDGHEDGGKGPKKDFKPGPYFAQVVPKSISVEGMVSCQNCKNVGSDSLTDAKPIAGAKVKLVCWTGPRYKSFFYATATTDSNGFFLISVSHFNFNTFSPVDDCVVFLVSSPLKACSTVTDINMGKTGGPLRPIPTFAPSENLMFSVGPFAFAPKQCSTYIPPSFVPSAEPGQSPPPYGNGSHY